MIKKFNEFDKLAYLKSKSLTEALDDESVNQNVDDKELEDYAFTGKAVYEDPFLLKITHIVKKRLDQLNMGEFAIYHDIVYLDNVPGVWFKGLDDNTKSIVCCRDRYGKSISIFDNFELDKKCTAIVTYTTKTLGFKDMLDQMIEDLNDSKSVNEGVINEAFRASTGYTGNQVEIFQKLSNNEKDYLYDLVKKNNKSTAQSLLMAAFTTGDPLGKHAMETFAAPKAPGAGAAKYLVGIAYDVVNKTYPSESVFPDLIADYTGGAPAIGTSSGNTYSCGDADDEEEARQQAVASRRQSLLAEDLEKYEETMIGLRDMAEAMCNYVKQNGKLDREDKSVMSRRAMLLTGKGGIGKTYTLKQVLKEKNMIENKDYIWTGSGNTTSDSIYSTLYEYNGKLIIFDDAPHLFDGEYRVSVWKNALQTDLEDCRIDYPGRESKMNVYNVKRLRGDRQKRYFMEIGRKSGEDKTDFYKKEMKKLGLTYSSRAANGVVSIDPKNQLSEQEIDVLMSEIDERWKAEEDNTQPAMPNSFLFNGLVIIITNDNREKFKNEVGEGGWGAITSRFRNFDVNPMAESLWSVMKKQILEEFNDKTLDDDLCTLPRDYTEEFIEEMEKLIVDPKYQGLTRRTAKAFGDILRGEKGRRTWKRTLRDELSMGN